MSGTKEGGEAMRATMIERYGSIEAWKQHMRELAHKGGKNGHTGGFFADRNRASWAGYKGGKVSKRGKNKNASQR